MLLSFLLEMDSRMRIVEIDALENRFKPKPRKVEPVEKVNLERYNKHKHNGKHIDVYA